MLSVFIAPPTSIWHHQPDTKRFTDLSQLFCQRKKMYVCCVVSPTYSSDNLYKLSWEFPSECKTWREHRIAFVIRTSAQRTSIFEMKIEVMKNEPENCGAIRRHLNPIEHIASMTMCVLICDVLIAIRVEYWSGNRNTDINHFPFIYLDFNVERKRERRFHSVISMRATISISTWKWF